jgi:hypothetical protein
VPDTSNPYGSWGNLARFRGQTQQDTSGLPDFIAQQITDDVKVDEGGTQTHNYDFHDKPWSGYQGEDGKYYVQLGDPSTWRGGDEDAGVKDRSKVVYDPNAGWITTADNLTATGIGGVDWRMVAAVVGAGAIGTIAGLVSEVGTGVAATDAAESGGTLALNAAGNGVTPYVGGEAAGGAAGGSLTGTMDTAGSTGFGGTTPLDAGAPTGTMDTAGSSGFGGTTPIDAGAPTGAPTVPDAAPAGGPAAQAPAPVSSAATAQPSTGIVNTARNAAGSISDWYGNLSPGARMVVNQGVSTAGRAAMTALSQRNAQQFQHEQEQRQRDDVIRRGKVPVFAPSAFTPKQPVGQPKSGGIINTVKGT